MAAEGPSSPQLFARGRNDRKAVGLITGSKRESSSRGERPGP